MAIKHRLPAMFRFGDFADVGGLITMGQTMRMLKTLVATLALVLLSPGSRPCHPTRLMLVIAPLLSAILLMAPAAASALAFTTSRLAEAQIRDIGDLVVKAPPDQALIDISAPLSLAVGGATISTLATFRSVVIPTAAEASASIRRGMRRSLWARTKRLWWSMPHISSSMCLSFETG